MLIAPMKVLEIHKNYSPLWDKWMGKNKLKLEDFKGLEKG